MSELTVPTAYGEGRLVIDAVSAGAVPLATLLLSHGAGGGIHGRDLAALAAALPAQGITVVRFEQPWRVAGRPLAGPAKTLDAGLVAAAGALSASGPLVVGGRSAGARSACRSAATLGAAGCLALAFPLHPPGRPGRSRADELGTGVPLLVVQGENDPFGRPEEFPVGIDLAPVPAADHGFKVATGADVSQDDALAILVEATLEWLVREIVGSALDAG